MSRRTLTVTKRGGQRLGTKIRFRGVSILSTRPINSSRCSVVIDGPPCIARDRGGRVRPGILS